ncbi:precorrin-6Y C5,15-methyltransferase (decarboxylating) subunit CbiT [Salinarchaeum sp. IM2453]|uniref:precorrin-6Y C5,15-methyltransferase (decarboxylating) subunit CbiT n=1 Tax=Salinarchaeum sp. IM2453 TaxID=2862870 RepID=UPI001C82AC51|nr:precorrin-6Y C5,15-methyltransferase (decarboxylating) subunit CbiT [Salinarchaeum sp. IM2453]QZA89808.1 precorrin-6Y C5,15-methyltransferase (decarboxylating) subunit CbiT [Salinarchaeum sp. IM2453]
MGSISLPHDAPAGPTKPEIRAVLIDKFNLDDDDHFVDVGSCTGAVSIAAARHAGKVTAIERNPNSVKATQKNIAANQTSAPVTVHQAEAPEAFPDEADAVFIGGSRNYIEVIDKALASGADRIIMNVARIERAGCAIETFRERDILADVLQIRVDHGYTLAGETAFENLDAVYMIIGSTTGDTI